MKKPRKPFLNLEDARIKLTDNEAKDKLKSPDFYPCPKCNGRKGEYDKYPAAYESPSFYNCHDCEGKGSCTKLTFECYFNAMISKWKNEIAYYYEIETLVEDALKKLTKEEVEALKKWWEFSL